KCKILKTWDSRLQFSPKGQFYSPGESVTLSCSEGYWPSPAVIKCVSNGSLPVWSETPTCQGKCETPPESLARGRQTELRGQGELRLCSTETPGPAPRSLCHCASPSDTMGWGHFWCNLLTVRVIPQGNSCPRDRVESLTHGATWSVYIEGGCCLSKDLLSFSHQLL
ncbi:unnamed protein product, partial [Lepidochelys olivacea]